MQTDINKIKRDDTIQLTTNSVFYKNIYESRVISRDRDIIIISIPYYKGLHVPLNVGFVLNLKIMTDYGMIEMVADVIERNIGNHTVTVSMQQEKVEYEHNKNKCKFLCVTSGKGGVGKTSFIINFAIALAELGKSVCIMDADLGMANVDVLLKASSPHNIIDVIDGNKEIEDIIVKAAGGIHIIAGGSGIQDLADLTEKQLLRITNGFSRLEDSFDYVLIDTGAGLSKNVTNFVFAADETIVITTPEPHAITDAYSIIKVVLEQNDMINMHLIINKAETNNEGEQVIKRVSNVVKNFLNYSLKPMGYLEDSKWVMKSIKAQEPFVLLYPTATVSKQLREIASNVVGNQELAGKSGSFVSKLRNLLRRTG